MNKKKLKAAGQVVYGVGQIASGIANATGHGLVGSYCRKKGMMNSARLLGRASVKSGTKNVKEGWKKFKEEDGSK